MWHLIVNQCFFIDVKLINSSMNSLVSKWRKFHFFPFFWFSFIVNRLVSPGFSSFLLFLSLSLAFSSSSSLFFPYSLDRSLPSFNQTDLKNSQIFKVKINFLLRPNCLSPIISVHFYPSYVVSSSLSLSSSSFVSSLSV